MAAMAFKLIELWGCSAGGLCLLALSFGPRMLPVRPSLPMLCMLPGLSFGPRMLPVRLSLPILLLLLLSSVLSILGLLDNCCAVGILTFSKLEVVL